MAEDATAVNDPVATQDAAPTESATVENDAPEVADPLLEALSSDEDSPVIEQAETKEEPEVKDESEEASEEDPETEEESETEAEKPLGKAEERKQQLNTEIRGLVEERRALREEIESLNARVYAPQTADELIEQGMSETDARVIALEQRQELTDFNNRVVEAQLELGEQSQRVLNEFPMFNPDSPEFDADIAAEAARTLDKTLIRDPNTGQIIGSHLSPYQIYKPIADAYTKSQVRGKIEGQKATETMLKNVDTPPSATPKESKKDPLLEILSSDD